MGRHDEVSYQRLATAVHVVPQHLSAVCLRLYCGVTDQHAAARRLCVGAAERLKSAEMVTGYIREADKGTKSGLDGVDF
jgi:hypothetical protein